MWTNMTCDVYGNMKSHTGGDTSMGYGIIHRKVLKHKINVKRSTETELVESVNIFYITFMVNGVSGGASI